MSIRISHLTHFTLYAGIAGHLSIGVITLFFPGIIHNYLWPPPLEQVPDLWLRYDAAVDLAFALGGMYALRQKNWIAARTFLFTSGGYVGCLLAVTILFLFTARSLVPVMWLYVLLAFLYLPLIAIAWQREAANLKATF